MRLRSIVLAMAMLVASPAVAAASEDELPEQCREADMSEEECYGIERGYAVSFDTTTRQPEPTAPNGAEGSAGTCVYRHRVYQHRNFAHMTVWTFHQEMTWCYGNGRVQTLRRISRWGDVANWVLIWRYDGVIDTQAANCLGPLGSQCCSDAGGCMYVRRYARGQFHACGGPLCTYKYPWIAQTGRAPSNPQGLYDSSAGEGW
jgi:hypothetical protein